ncbi:MAG: hypothetical protein IAE87_18990 [Rhodobacteraceae bacterium]|jgi:hypothetical protein|nr:hypothetical protein [Paracoccaceae bacterium]
MPPRTARLAPVLAPAVLAACVALQGPAMPDGPLRLDLDGAVFQAEIFPGAPGAMLTADGARPVPGATLRLTREGRALARDEGALAKKAARAGCTAAGGRFAEAALGRFDGAGAWVFPGGCA